jgi:GxxExxY protein
LRLVSNGLPAVPNGIPLECSHLLKNLRELLVPIEYKGFVFEEPLRLDLLIDDCLIVELKAVEKVRPIHKAQLLSYMKLLNKPLGLLINFHEIVLKDGITGFFSEMVSSRDGYAKHNHVFG